MEKTMSAPVMGNDPFQEFLKWMQLAVDASSKYPDAMTLSTVREDGRPAARTVLYKGLSKGGLQFFTNYQSAKSQELILRPDAALTFFWPDIYRQLRIEGRVEKTTRAESESYFATRARESQLGAWTSNQSCEIPDSQFLEKHFEEIKNQFKDQKVIPCPDYWGGFRLIPNRFEFWTGNTARLHYRYFYQQLKGGGWQTGWLAP